MATPPAEAGVQENQVLNENRDGVVEQMEPEVEIETVQENPETAFREFKARQARMMALGRLCLLNYKIDRRVYNRYRIAVSIWKGLVSRRSSGVMARLFNYGDSNVFRYGIYRVDWRE
jgi:hypothetical protein